MPHSPASQMPPPQTPWLAPSLLGHLLNLSRPLEPGLPTPGRRYCCFRLGSFLACLLWGKLADPASGHSRSPMKSWTRSLPAAVSEPRRQWIPHPQSSFQMGADPAEGLTTASWEIPTHSHPAKLLPDPWPSEIVSGSNGSAQHHLTLGVVCYVAGDNRHTHACLSDLILPAFSPCLPPCSPACCAWNTPVVPDQGPGPSCSDRVTLGLRELAFSCQ